MVYPSSTEMAVKSPFHKISSPLLLSLPELARSDWLADANILKRMKMCKGYYHFAKTRSTHHGYKEKDNTTDWKGQWWKLQPRSIRLSSLKAKRHFLKLNWLSKCRYASQELSERCIVQHEGWARAGKRKTKPQAIKGGEVNQRSSSGEVFPPLKKSVSKLAR